MERVKAKYRLIFARKGLNSEDRGLVQIEVYFNRQSRKYISTDIFLTSGQWNSKTRQISSKHPNYIRLNEFLKNRIAEIEAYELDMIRDNKPFNKNVLDRWLNQGGDDFYTAACNSVKTDGKLQLVTQNRTLMHLKTFSQVCGPLSVGEIQYIHIKEFDKWLKDEGLHTNTIATYHKSIKRCINALIREGVMKENPYHQFSFKMVKTRKEFLTPREVQILAEMNFANENIQATIDRYLISCGTALRFSDIYMLHSDHVYPAESGRGLVVDLERMKKVEYPVKNATYEYFSGVANERLQKYIPEGGGYLFYKKRVGIGTQNAIDNKNLKLISLQSSINKNLTFHTSRHTALTEVASQTGNVFSVMKFGGISKIETAQIYIHLASEKF